MSIPSEIEVATGLSKVVLIAIVMIVAVVAITGWLWWNSHMNAKNAAAVPKAQAIVSGAQATAGGDAVNALSANQDKNAQTDEKTRNNTYVTNNFPAAKVEVDPAFIAAFDRAICVYRSAASIPECQRLQQLNSK